MLKKVIVGAFVLVVFWGLAIWMLLGKFGAGIALYAFVVGPFASIFAASSVPTTRAADGWVCSLCGTHHKNTADGCFVCGATRRR